MTCGWDWEFGKKASEDDNYAGLRQNAQAVMVYGVGEGKNGIPLIPWCVCSWEKYARNTRFMAWAGNKCIIDGVMDVGLGIIRKKAKQMVWDFGDQRLQSRLE